MKHLHIIRVVIAAVLLVAFASSGTQAAAASTLTFSKPAQIAGSPYGSTHNLSALDCPSTSLCVAGDIAGNLIVSAQPTGGASTWSVAEEVDPSARIDTISCASRSLCIAGASDGAILHTTNPTGGTSAWKETTGIFRSGNALISLSCPTKTLCVGVDKRGQVLYSRNPTGSAKTWKFSRVLRIANDWLFSISCPTSSQCVAVDKRGHTVAHSTAPTKGARAWHLTTLKTRPISYSYASVSCASKTLCVIDGGQGAQQAPFIATAKRPNGGTSAWSIGRPPKAIENLVAVSCPTTRLCVAGGRTFGTEIAYSTDPAGGAKTYRAGLTAPTSPPTGYPGVDGLSCASASQCAFFASNGQVAVTTTPTTTSTANWPALVVDQYNKLESVTCPSATACIAGGALKRVFTSANPPGGAAAWTATTVPVASDRVACGAPDQCVIGDGVAGDLAASSTPLTGGWIEAQTSGDLPDGGGIAVLACTAGPFCIAGPYEVQSDSDDEGTSTLTTSDPTGGTSAWAYSESFLEGGINGGPHAAKGTVPSLACPSSALCVAGDAKGGILTNTTPANVDSWHYTRTDGSASIVSLACPATTLCVGADSEGRVIHSTNPTSGTWSSATIDKGTALTAVACASTGFCVAVDGRRHAFVSTDPTGTASAWHRIDAGDGDLTAITCPTTGLCVAVDGQGNEVTATG